jgi:2-acylglycerol O-acyltransferase 2
MTPQIYEQIPNEKGTPLYTIQKKFQNVFGLTLPLFHGRDTQLWSFHCRLFTIRQLTALSDNWGLLPYRRQIIAVSESPVVLLVQPAMEWTLTSRDSWAACPCSEDEQPDHRADQGGARGIYNGALAVSGARFLIPKVTDFRFCSKDLVRRIWNTFKDEFARTRRRELSIID